MTKGQRWIDGRCYMLFCALDYWQGIDDEEEALAREMKGAKERYEYVRVIKDRRRFRAYVYVL